MSPARLIILLAVAEHLLDAVELVMALSQSALEVAIDSLDLVAMFVGILGSHSPPHWGLQLEPCR
jgi:hypothetical protein